MGPDLGKADMTSDRDSWGMNLYPHKAQEGVTAMKSGDSFGKPS